MIWCPGTNVLGFVDRRRNPPNRKKTISIPQRHLGEALTNSLILIFCRLCHLCCHTDCNIIIALLYSLSNVKGHKAPLRRLATP